MPCDVLSIRKNQVRKTIANRLWVASMCTSCINITAISVYCDLLLLLIVNDEIMLLLMG